MEIAFKLAIGLAYLGLCICELSHVYQKSYKVKPVSIIVTKTVDTKRDVQAE